MEGTLFSWEWWVSVVVVGVIINVLIVYLVRANDAALSRVSNRWAMRSRARGEAFEEEVARLAEHPEDDAFHFAREVRCHFRALFYLITAVGLLIAVAHFAGGWSGWAFVASAFIFTVIAFAELSNAIDLQLLVVKARDRRRVKARE